MNYIFKYIEIKKGSQYYFFSVFWSNSWRFANHKTLLKKKRKKKTNPKL